MSMVLNVDFGSDMCGNIGGSVMHGNIGSSEMYSNIGSSDMYSNIGSSEMHGNIGSSKCNHSIHIHGDIHYRVDKPNMKNSANFESHFHCQEEVVSFQSKIYSPVTDA